MLVEFRDGSKFLSTPSARRATRSYMMASSTHEIFLSTPSARRATWITLEGFTESRISIHAFREEGDAATSPSRCREMRFLSTPSARRATIANPNVGPDDLFLSTPSARRATRLQRRDAAGRRISIHALREEGDMLRTHPCYESMQFLSTPSARRATASMYPPICRKAFLSTPSARRATRRAGGKAGCVGISIHAFREEGDNEGKGFLRPAVEFLSTPSARRATRPRWPRYSRWPISIHALREEGDPPLRSCAPWDPYFYPRPPRGGRPGRSAR